MARRFEQPRLTLDEGSAIELARRGATGDLTAEQALLEMLWPSMARVVVGVLGSAHPELDDTIQQSMIALTRALPNFRGECHPAGFGCRIAFRTACLARRRSAQERTRHSQLMLTDLPELAESPSDVADGERRRRIWRELLSHLPEEQAETLTLRVVMGWSLEEVARATGVPTNTVRSRMRLAKEALRRQIEAVPELAAEIDGGP